MISNELNFPVSSLQGSAGFWFAAHVKDFLLPWDGALLPSLSPIRFSFTDFHYLCCSNVKALSYLTHFSQSSEKCIVSLEEIITTNNIQSSIHVKSGYFWTILFIKST